MLRKEERVCNSCLVEKASEWTIEFSRIVWPTLRAELRLGILNLNQDHSPWLCISLQPWSARKVGVPHRLRVQLSQGWDFAR